MRRVGDPEWFVDREVIRCRGLPPPWPVAAPLASSLRAPSAPSPRDELDRPGKQSPTRHPLAVTHSQSGFAVRLSPSGSRRQAIVPQALAVRLSSISLSSVRLSSISLSSVSFFGQLLVGQLLVHQVVSQKCSSLRACSANRAVRRRSSSSRGDGREGARSELASGAATGPGGRQPPAPDHLTTNKPFRIPDPAHVLIPVLTGIEIGRWFSTEGIGLGRTLAAHVEPVVVLAFDRAGGCAGESFAGRWRWQCSGPDDQHQRPGRESRARRSWLRQRHGAAVLLAADRAQPGARHFDDGDQLRPHHDRPELRPQRHRRSADAAQPGAGRPGPVPVAVRHGANLAEDQHRRPAAVPGQPAARGSGLRQRQPAAARLHVQAGARARPGPVHSGRRIAAAQHAGRHSDLRAGARVHDQRAQDRFPDGLHGHGARSW